MPEITTATGLQNQILKAFPDMNRNYAKRVAYRTQRQADFANFAAQFNAAAEAYTRDVSDETGEQAVNNVLIQYLTKYGTLTATKTVNTGHPAKTLEEVGA